MEMLMIKALRSRRLASADCTVVITRAIFNTYASVDFTGVTEQFFVCAEFTGVSACRRLGGGRRRLHNGISIPYS
jgi:hypothetical protein